MSVTTQRINQANAVVSGKISAENLEQKTQNIAQQFAKNAKIQGFRKGKTPLAIIKRHYAKEIQQQVEQESIREVLSDAIKKLELDQAQILGNPAITQFDRNGEEIDFEFKLSITPQIDLSKLKSCTPEVTIKEPDSKKIDERIDEIAKNYTPLIEAKEEEALTKGQTARIDFEGFVKNKPFKGGKAEGFDLLIGGGQFIAGFEDQLIGMKKNEEKNIVVTFPNEYPVKELAGQEATFKVKLHAIKIKDEVKINDELAQKVLNQPNATIDTLKEQIALQLKNEEKIRIYNQEAKPKFVDEILQTIQFDLPELIVEQEMNILLNNYARTLDAKELESFKQDSKAIEAKQKELKEEATKSVQITFIVDAAAKAYQVQVQDNEVLQALYYEAMMGGQDPKAMLDFYQKNNLLPAVKMAMLEDRILTMLLDEKLNSTQETNKEKSTEATQEASNHKEA